MAPGLISEFKHFFFPYPPKFSNLQSQEEHEKEKMHLKERTTDICRQAPADQELARSHPNL